jgi:hypothetical protein
MSPASNIDMSYDHGNNILDVIRKDATKETRNIEVQPGVFFRLDLNKGEIVGLIIQNASEHYPGIETELAANPYQCMEHFDFILDLINSGNKISK